MIHTCCDYCRCKRVKVHPEIKPNSLHTQLHVMNELDLLYNRIELLRETSTTIHKSIKEQSEKLKLEKSENIVVSLGSYNSEESKNEIITGTKSVGEHLIFLNVMEEN